MHINSSKIDGSHKVHVLDVPVQVLTGNITELTEHLSPTSGVTDLQW